MKIRIAAPLLLKATKLVNGFVSKSYIKESLRYMEIEAQENSGLVFRATDSYKAIQHTLKNVEIIEQGKCLIEPNNLLVLLNNFASKFEDIEIEASDDYIILKTTGGQFNLVRHIEKNYPNLEKIWPTKDKLEPAIYFKTKLLSSVVKTLSTETDIIGINIDNSIARKHLIETVNKNNQIITKVIVLGSRKDD